MGTSVVFQPLVFHKPHPSEVAVLMCKQREKVNQCNLFNNKTSHIWLGLWRMYLLTHLPYILSVIREPHLIEVGYIEIVSNIQEHSWTYMKLVHWIFCWIMFFHQLSLSLTKTLSRSACWRSFSKFSIVYINKQPLWVKCCITFLNENVSCI